MFGLLQLLTLSPLNKPSTDTLIVSRVPQKGGRPKPESNPGPSTPLVAPGRSSIPEKDPLTCEGVCVFQVSGFGPTLRTLSGSAGAPAPAGRGVQAQTVRGDGVYSQHSGFKYCFREVKDGQVRGAPIS